MSIIMEKKKAWNLKSLGICEKCEVLNKSFCMYNNMHYNRCAIIGVIAPIRQCLSYKKLTSKT
ncbi:hypothetical protein M0R19_05725 [Candidatus Pacearchaeota archaeon]|nr:hypothetical protein [Candidatus Pacearchaeota archaeon]